MVVAVLRDYREASLSTEIAAAVVNNGVGVARHTEQRQTNNYTATRFMEYLISHSKATNDFPP